MKVFRNMILEGSQDNLEKVLERVIEAIANNPDDGWRRNKETETKINSVPKFDSKLYCFSCSESEKRRESNLWLSHAFKENRLSVSNIVPKKIRELSYDEYNYILEEFGDLFLVPATQNLEVEVTLTEAEIDLNKLIKPETVEFLHKFSEEGNRFDKRYLPFSRKDWYLFLVEAHKNRASLNSEILERWLKEEEGWSEDIASNLIEEYQFARTLLDYYEQYQ
ncbi:MAG: hypothetical protein SXA11_16015 [Cyanobacteriota bacterium]|nr:hypothetical protein [Cyanobacteriota bacterium]